MYNDIVVHVTFGPSCSLGLFERILKYHIKIGGGVMKAGSRCRRPGEEGMVL